MLKEKEAFIKTIEKIEKDKNEKVKLMSVDLTRITGSISTLEKDFLSTQIAKMKSLELVYKGSRDTFAGSAFHSKCDNRKDTVVIIHTTQGKRFGGYTSCVWDSSSSYKTDSTKTSFLFSLTTQNMQRFCIKAGGISSTIYCQNNYGPTFGAFDIYISNNSNTNSSNYCNFNQQYSNTDTNLTNVEIAGGYFFQVTEVEVYQVIY